MSDWKQIWIFGLLAALLLLTPVAAGRSMGDPRVTVQLSTGIAKLGEPVVIIVKVEGTLDGSIGELPKTKGLAIGPVSGPKTERMSTFRNGRVSDSLSATWYISVVASAEGDFEIPPFLISAGGPPMNPNRCPFKFAGICKVLISAL